MNIKIGCFIILFVLSFIGITNKLVAAEFTIPCGGGTFYAVFNSDSTEYKVKATPASGCEFVANPMAGNGWTGIVLNTGEASAKKKISDPLKSP